MGCTKFQHVIQYFYSSYLEETEGGTIQMFKHKVLWFMGAALLAVMSLFPLVGVKTTDAASLKTSEPSQESMQQQIDYPVPARVTPLDGSLLILPNDAIEPQAANPPTMYWNLSTRSYSGHFEGHGVYTNYYFSPNTNNTLYLQENVSGSTGQHLTYKVTLFDKTAGIARYANTLQSDTGGWLLTYSNLISNHFYYLYWEVQGSGQVSGDFQVSW